MRPDAIEVLRGLQAALSAEIGPEVGSPYGQSVVQTAQMLLESVAAEVETAADDLWCDNRSLQGLLARGADAVAEVDGELAGEIKASLAEPDTESLALAALTARNRRLRALLDRLLAACEDAASDESPDDPLTTVRADAYRHLREVAARGWSFWDMSSFRERMARLRGG